MHVKEGKETRLTEEREKNMVGAINRSSGGLKVTLRAFCCKARGGGGS